MLAMWLIPLLVIAALWASEGSDRKGRTWDWPALLVLIPLVGWLMMMGGHGMGWMHGYGGWGWNGWDLLWNAVIIIGMVALVYLLLRRSGASNSRAMAYLRERLARGEITEEEYDRLAAILRRDGET